MDAPTLRRATTGERGGVAVIIALTLLPLVLAVGFATDLGLWLHRGRELQSAADLAALAGAARMPDEAAARATALETMRLNGIDPAVVDHDVTVDFPSAGVIRVRVTDDDVPAFLASPVVDHLSISRSATATYLPPLGMGSPTNGFGAQALPMPATGPQLWASIAGPNSPKQQGEGFATDCATLSGPTDNTCTGPSALYRPDGYWYGIEVGDDDLGQITVEVFDAGWYEDTCTFPDEVCDTLWWGGSPGGTAFEVFAPDATPHDARDNPAMPGSLCKQYIAPSADAATYDDRWATLCTFVATDPGIYVLNVRMADFRPWVTAPVTGTDLRNVNSYAVRATSTATGQPRLFGLDALGFMSNADTSRDIEWYLAEVHPGYAGQTMEIKIFDPGEVPPNTTLEVRMPDGSVPPCSYRVQDHDLSNDPAWIDAATCRVVTNPAGNTRPYNNQWLVLRVPLPTDYTCTLAADGCFWTVFQNLDQTQVDGFGNPLQATERQTWTVDMLGDPLRLVD